MTKIRAFVNGWNSWKRLLLWTENPDDIRAKIGRKRNLSQR